MAWYEVQLRHPGSDREETVRIDVASEERARELLGAFEIIAVTPEGGLSSTKEDQYADTPPVSQASNDADDDGA